MCLRDISCKLNTFIFELAVYYHRFSVIFHVSSIHLFLSLQFIITDSDFDYLQHRFLSLAMGPY